MPKETEVTFCPNPKCHREIEEPILLNVLSATPVEQYHACPHCFFKLDSDTENEQDTEQVSGPPSHPSLEKVLDAISTQPQKEIREEKEKTENELPAKPAEEEASPSWCTHHFGYLASRPKNDPIPQECLTCPKNVDCMLKLGTT